MSFQLRGVTVRRQGQCVLSSIEHGFESGLVSGVVGPNGSGKSSLLRTLYGYLEVDEGSVLLENRELTRWNPRELASRLGVCPQESEPSLDFRIDQVLALPLGGDLSTMREQSARLDFLRLETLFERTLSQLSGGERQRVRLGMALMKDAPWLILDEPINHLDLATGWSLMRYLQKPRKGGVLLALHDLTTAAHYCQNLLVLKDGEKVAAGPPREVLTPELLRSVFRLDAKIDWSTEPPGLKVLGVEVG